MRYIDMTPEQRKAEYNDNLCAFDDMRDFECAMAASGRGPARIETAERFAKEAGFILRVAKSRGDEWAKKL